MQSGPILFHLLCEDRTWRAGEELAWLTKRIERDASQKARDAAVVALREFIDLASAEIRLSRVAASNIGAPLGLQ